MKGRNAFTMTPEAFQAFRDRDRLERDALAAGLTASFDAIERGDDPDSAMRAAALAVDPDSQLGLPITYDDEKPAESRSLATLAVGRLRGDGWTVAKQRAFLVHLATTGCVNHACAHVGLSRQSAYMLRRRAPHSVFAIAWDAAIQMARQTLLDEATERALAGREVPVWYRGEQVGTRVVHNDRLLMFLLAHQPPPAHPVLDQRELLQLWPAMLDAVDRILPPPISPERIAELDPGKHAD